MYRYSLLVFLALFIACQPTEKPREKEQIKSIIPGSNISIQIEQDSVDMFRQPRINAQKIGSVRMGSSLYYAGEMTSETTRIQRNGVWYDEPWISVYTPEGDTGWIHGGGVDMDGDDSEEIGEVLLQKRMTFLMEELTEDILDYREEYANCNTDTSFLNIYRKGEWLREKIVEKLNQKLAKGISSDMPDMFWLESIMPGYVLELVAEGTQYYLFKDFQKFNSLAKQTSGNRDEAFTEMMFQVYDRDSIEFTFPSWFIQTWDYGGHSLLGEGKHFQVLQSANQILTSDKDSLFKKEILAQKQAILNDIINPENSYWLSQEKIVAELDNMIKSDLNILSKKDKIILEERKKQFLNPESGIELNIRSGE